MELCAFQWQLTFLALCLNATLSGEGDTSYSMIKWQPPLKVQLNATQVGAQRNVFPRERELIQMINHMTYMEEKQQTLIQLVSI